MTHVPFWDMTQTLRHMMDDTWLMIHICRKTHEGFYMKNDTWWSILEKWYCTMYMKRVTWWMLPWLMINKGWNMKDDTRSYVHEGGYMKENIRRRRLQKGQYMKDDTWRAEHEGWNWRTGHERGCMKDDHEESDMIDRTRRMIHEGLYNEGWTWRGECLSLKDMKDGTLTVCTWFISH